MALPTPALLGLPTLALECVLRALHPRDRLSCLQTCKHLRDAVAEHFVLQQVHVECTSELPGCCSMQGGHPCHIHFTCACKSQAAKQRCKGLELLARLPVAARARKLSLESALLQLDTAPTALSAFRLLTTLKLSSCGIMSAAPLDITSAPAGVTCPAVPAAAASPPALSLQPRALAKLSLSKLCVHESVAHSNCLAQLLAPTFSDIQNYEVITSCSDYPPAWASEEKQGLQWKPSFSEAWQAVDVKQLVTCSAHLGTQQPLVSVQGPWHRTLLEALPALQRLTHLDLGAWKCALIADNVSTLLQCKALRHVTLHNLAVWEPLNTPDPCPWTQLCMSPRGSQPLYLLSFLHLNLDHLQGPVLVRTPDPLQLSCDYHNSINTAPPAMPATALEYAAAKLAAVGGLLVDAPAVVQWGDKAPPKWAQTVLPLIELAPPTTHGAPMLQLYCMRVDAQLLACMPAGMRHALASLQLVRCSVCPDVWACLLPRLPSLMQLTIMEGGAERRFSTAALLQLMGSLDGPQQLLLQRRQATGPSPGDPSSSSSSSSSCRKVSSSTHDNTGEPAHPHAAAASSATVEEHNSAAAACQAGWAGCNESWTAAPRSAALHVKVVVPQGGELPFGLKAVATQAQELESLVQRYQERLLRLNTTVEVVQVAGPTAQLPSIGAAALCHTKWALQSLRQRLLAWLYSH